MGFISSMADNNELVEVKFYNKEYNPGTGEETYSSTAVLTVQSLFWTGAAAERKVSDKYKAEVVGMIVFDFEDYTATVKEEAKAEISGKDYSVIYVDNVAMQNKTIQIPVKNF
jgi:hypothetical protein